MTEVFGSPTGLVGAIAILAMAFYVLVKEVIAPLVKKRNGLYGPPPEELSRMLKDIMSIITTGSRRIEDLHVWHSPDADGEQGWKGKQLERLIKSIDDHLQQHSRAVVGMTKAVEIMVDQRKELNLHLSDLISEIRKDRSS